MGSLCYFEYLVYGKVNEEKLELVKEEETEIRIDDIENGLSVKEASNKHDIKLMTLYHHIRKNKKEGELNDTLD